MARRRSKSSRRWLDEHFDDPHVKQAQREGWRSRAAFKLAEIDAKDRVLRPRQTVVDLGAAPGGWSQLAAQRVGARGRVLAVDLLEIPPIPGVETLRADFTDDAVLADLLARLPEAGADVVLSDLAPNISGMKAIDQPRAMHLAELALDFAERCLAADGSLVVKLFQGEGFDEYLRELRACFRRVSMRKPEASRNQSREQYAVCRGFRGRSP